MWSAQCGQSGRKLIADKSLMQADHSTNDIRVYLSGRTANFGDRNGKLWNLRRVSIWSLNFEAFQRNHLARMKTLYLTVRSLRTEPDEAVKLRLCVMRVLRECI